MNRRLVEAWRCASAAVRRIRTIGLLCAALLACGAAARPVRSAEAVASPVLVWHVETEGGTVVDSREPDVAINPASVVKLVTSLRALSTLGPAHRFETRFGTDAHLPARDGVLRGSLFVTGSGDPDFQFENAVLVARYLRSAGVREVRGDLVVDRSFWLGWERGSAGRERDPQRRALAMAQRLSAAWEPQRWSSDEGRAWERMAARFGWDVRTPARVRIDGGLRVGSSPAVRQLAAHRSEPLLTALRRFNVFSNNDIERLDLALGPPSGMAGFLARRWGRDVGATTFETSSGLGHNGITPRMVVRVLHDLRALLRTQGRKVGDLLPVLGCGESTLFELFPHLRASGVARGLAGKTGTLNTTDGGVAALAGFLPTADGETLFMVAAPHCGPDLRAARAAEEAWVAALAARVGGSSGRTCPQPVPTSDAEAEVRAPTER